MIGRVDQHGERRADAELLDEDDLRGREGADRHREQQGRGGHDPARALEADRDRFGVRRPAVVGLLDPREQEHAVVGRQPEPDREEEDRLGGVERALAV